MYGTTRNSDALQQVFPMRVISHLAFCGWGTTDACCKHMSVIFDVRQCVFVDVLQACAVELTDTSQVDSLHPVNVNPTLASVQVPVNRWGSPRCSVKAVGKVSPALATRRWSSKATWMRSGRSGDSIQWVLLVLGWFSVSKTIIPEAGSTFLPFQHAATLISSVDRG